MKRIFIMSSERSGSNLLRSMLGRHPDIVAPTAVHFTTNMANLAFFYGNYNDDAVLYEVVTDMIEVAASHIVPWKWNINTIDVLPKIKKKNFWGCMAGLFDSIALTKRKCAWVCKDNNLFDYMAEILCNMDNAYVIYLVRDGRDVALSFFNVPGGPSTINKSAKLWTREQMTCLRLVSLFRKSIHVVRYEDLISNPEKQLRKICSFLEIDYSHDMLLFAVSETSQRMSDRSKYWENLNKPVLKNNYNKWKKRMSHIDALRYQQVAALPLMALGYDTVEVDYEWRHNRLYYFLKDYFIEVFYALKVNFWSHENKLRNKKRSKISSINRKLKKRKIACDFQ